MNASLTKALIFDFDGLVVDTETPLYDAWRELYQEHGHDLALETYVECVGSTTLRFDPITHLQELADTDLHAGDLEERHRAKVREELALRDTLPGIRERIAEAQALGISLAIASSSSSDWIHPWLERLGLTDAFDVVRTRDLVKEAKPSPELFLTAAEELRVEPHEAVVFEDSYNGLQAAVAARMPCVAVPNRVTGEFDFSQAALVMASLADRALTEILEAIAGT